MKRMTALVLALMVFVAVPVAFVASYPTAVVTFTTKTAGDVIQPAHINAIQDEVVAIENGLLNGVEHNLFPESTADLRTLGTSSKFWAKVFVTAAIIGAESTSGCRLDIDSGALAVREGDDSADCDLKALAASLSGAGITLTGTDPSAGLTASGASGSNLRLRANGSVVLQADLDGNANEFFLFRNGAGADVVTIDETGLMTLAPVTFASLPSATNGSIQYCTDCTIASPCASGGTGAFAKRLNATWVCN